MASNPIWLQNARHYLGLKEVPGKKHHYKILDWWRLTHLAFKDDETPWCAGFVGGTLEEVGIRSSRSGAARSYTKWGVKLSQPAVGAIVVFWRGSRKGYQGHVGYVVGQDRYGHLMVLGGNQGDAVSIKPFTYSRVLGYRWPSGESLPTAMNYKLPVLTSDGKASTNEA